MSYKEKIQTIYIDPPYNTGNDGFIYKDNYKHSSWLSMMENRLKLAKGLMKDDGVIFTSIDDNEVDNLKKLEDIVFGDENFITIFKWLRTNTPANLSKKSKNKLEYILCYEKNRDNIRFKGNLKKSIADNPLVKGNILRELIFRPGFVDILFIKDGVIQKGIYGTDKYRYELLNDIIVENFKNKNSFKIKANFSWTQEKLEEEVKKGTIIRIKSKNLVLSYEKKNTLPDIPSDLIDKKEGVDTNENASHYVNKHLSLQFTYPKPFSLLKYLINFKTNIQDIILDFFAGSGTTADAVIRLNQEDGGKRKFILVEMNDYFETIIIPRFKKIAFSLNWKNGKPQDNKGPGIFFKYIKLNQYQDYFENESLIDSATIEESDNIEDMVLQLKQIKQKVLNS